MISMERYVPFETDEFYHVYNRGVDKRKIFFVDRDWDVFQWLLFARNCPDRIDIPKSLGGSWQKGKKQSEPLVDIIAYALMGNHFHLLLREKQDDGISTFMRKLLTSYAMYMNKKYNRSGPLMCRPFRAKYVDSDEYFRWLVSYIHMNPIDQIEPDWEENGISDKQAAIKFLREYKYSSYYDYFVDTRDESLILNKEALPVDVNNLEDLSEMLEQVGQYEFTSR